MGRKRKVELLPMPEIPHCEQCNKYGAGIRNYSEGKVLCNECAKPLFFAYVKRRTGIIISTSVVLSLIIYHFL